MEYSINKVVAEEKCSLEIICVCQCCLSFCGLATDQTTKPFETCCKIVICPLMHNIEFFVVLVGPWCILVYKVCFLYNPLNGLSGKNI